MYKLWAKAICNNKIIKSITVSCNENISIEEKRKKCFNEIFYKLDVSAPIWLEKYKNDFYEFKLLTFRRDDFIDEVYFDKLEIDLIDDESNNKKQE